MTLTNKGLLLGLLIIVLAILSVLFSIYEITDLSIFFSVIASIMLIFLARKLIGNYSNFTVVFLAFSCFYGLSGPIAVNYGKGIPNVFPAPYLVDYFLLHYSLAVLGITIGLIIFGSLKSSEIDIKYQMPHWNEKILLILMYVFATTASLMEMVNLIRAGGFEVLFAGKAVYQSVVSDLTGTLPSQEMMLLATSFLGLTLSNSTKIKSKLCRLSIITSFLLLGIVNILILVILGQRGELLSLVVVFIIGYLYFSPLKRIKPKILIIILVLYLSMSFLYGIRSQLGYVLSTKDWDILITRISKPEFWITILNPASNEFGAPFGNFNTYILYGKRELKWGRTYITGLTVLIPRFIWPGKPQSVTYEFRDTFFPEWVQRGSISGTAYSSILEAYVNFGTIGVPIVYFLIALAMGWLEKKRLHSRSLAFTIFYLTLLPEAIIFHRSSFDMPLFWPLLLSFVGTISYIFFNSIVYKSFPKRRIFDFE
ncbi:MAG TPA: O-antigen polymerase [Bacteroidia bacterium]